MKNTVDPYNWHHSVHLRWVILPILAYLLSWMTGVGIILFFPVFLTIAQYFIFTAHPAVARPGAWFFTLPITLYVWMKWGPAITYSQPGGILPGVIAYYAGQLVNTLFVPLVIRKGSPELVFNWFLSNAVALAIWVGLFKLLIAGWSKDELHSAGAFAMFFVYPGIALIANAISGFLLNSKSIVMYETD